MTDQNRLEILEKQVDEINRCFRCGNCRTVCPSFEESGLEYSSPRGRVQFAKAALNGDLTLDEVFEEKILDCLNCLKCEEICPSSVPVSRIVMACRAELVKKGKLDVIKKLVFNGVIKNSVFMRLCSWAGSLGQKCFLNQDSFLEVMVPRFAGMEDKQFPILTGRSAVNGLPEINPSIYGKKTMRVGYFIGCATNFLYPEIAESVVGVFTRNRVEVVIPRGQVCCGIPVYSSGDYSNATKLAEKNLEVFRGLGIDCIITDCSSCSSALKHDVEELLGVDAFNVPVYDLTEFLVNIIEIDRDFGELNLNVTYHDPCHLIRGQGISNEPRELLTMVPGVELVEMKDSDTCCGGAGTFSYTHHKLSRKIGGRKVENIRNTGAEYVATPCPSCKMQIDDLLNHEGLEIKTIHPVEILDMSYRKKEIFDSEFLIVDSC